MSSTCSPSSEGAFATTRRPRGNDRVVLLSDGFWTRRLGRDPEILGTALVLDDEVYTVVGVMPPRFHFPPDAADIELWIPLTIDERLFGVRAMRVYSVVARLKPGVTPPQAEAEMEAIAAGIAEENPGEQSWLERRRDARARAGPRRRRDAGIDPGGRGGSRASHRGA